MHTYLHTCTHIHNQTTYTYARQHTVDKVTLQPDLLPRIEMSLKTRFKRGKGIGMTEVVRESVPDRRGLKSERSLSISHSSNMRFPEKSSIRRRTELTGRSIYMDEFREILWSRATDSRKSENGYLIVYSIRNRQPVERVKEWRNMVKFRSSANIKL